MAPYTTQTISVTYYAPAYYQRPAWRHPRARRRTAFWREPLFESSGSTAAHSPPPVALVESTAPPFPVVPSAPMLPRRTPRACLAARRARRPVRSRPGGRP